MLCEGHFIKQFQPEWAYPKLFQPNKSAIFPLVLSLQFLEINQPTVSISRYNTCVKRLWVFFMVVPKMNLKTLCKAHSLYYFNYLYCLHKWNRIQIKTCKWSVDLWLCNWRNGQTGYHSHEKYTKGLINRMPSCPIAGQVSYLGEISVI